MNICKPLESILLLMFSVLSLEFFCMENIKCIRLLVCANAFVHCNILYVPFENSV